MPGQAIVSNFTTPFDEKFTEVKHQSLFFNEVETIRKFLSLPDDSPRGIATLPRDRILSNLSVEELNRPDFTFTGQDWQAGIAAIRAYNPNLATLVGTRENIEELRINATIDVPNLLTAAITGANPIPPDLVDRSTATTSYWEAIATTKLADLLAMTTFAAGRVTISSLAMKATIVSSGAKVTTRS